MENKEGLNRVMIVCINIFVIMCLFLIYLVVFVEKRIDEIVWYENLRESGEERIYVFVRYVMRVLKVVKMYILCFNLSWKINNVKNLNVVLVIRKWRINYMLVFYYLIIFI